MKKVIEKKKCTGCSACANICPKNAITMIKDEEGFLHPEIDQVKCINCGLCQRTCPVLNTKTNEAINECYAGYAIDKDILKKSSSGGIFSIVANFILNKNGIVIGASLDNDLKLKHLAVEKSADLDKITGSKYIQSELGNIFKFVKEKVVDKKILFVGTPCQIAGLKAFLKKDFENLICIDVVCHGVPSANLFHKYIDELEQQENEKVDMIDFRDKSTGWSTYSTSIYYKTKKISHNHNEDQYMKLFLSDVALRECCYNCNFKLGNKYSDITLGDFWGITENYPEMYNKDGVSGIIINTDKGRIIFDTIKASLQYKECNIKEILDGNPSLKVSSNRPQNRDLFFKELDTTPISLLCKKYSKKEYLVKKILRKIKRMLK